MHDLPNVVSFFSLLTLLEYTQYEAPNILTNVTMKYPYQLLSKLSHYTNNIISYY